MEIVNGQPPSLSVIVSTAVFWPPSSAPAEGLVSDRLIVSESSPAESLVMGTVKLLLVSLVANVKSPEAAV